MEQDLYGQVRETQAYQDARGELVERVENGDACAATALIFLNQVIPPEAKYQPPVPPKPIGKPQIIPRPPTPEVQKKHIKRTGKKIAVS